VIWAIVGAAVGGLAVGSFLNVVAYRVPRGMSVLRPPSACPSCGHRIRARDNIPVISWMLLRARCRDCGGAISVRYPLVEAGTGALFAAAVAVIGLHWVLPAYLWFAAVALVLAVVDLDLRRIPNRILFPGVVVGTVLLVVGTWLDGEPWSALAWALVGGGAYFGLLFVVVLVVPGGFGFGDVKLAFLLGEFLAYRSWETLAVGVFAAFLIGGLVALALLLARRVSRKDVIAFGPALVAGAFVALAVAQAVADWYLG
jgi:leader peptidase (prepilin peptidase)/N-methyltransferase